MSTLSRESLTKFAEEHRSAFESHLKTMVEIPSISSSPKNRKDLDGVAESGAELIRKYGGKAEVLATDGAPLCHGLFFHSDSAPTVTVYNHLDVQPANEPEWQTDPFKLKIEDGRYRGRGATDDKGPALTALLGAVAAHRAGLPVNIKFLWETEEEIGSPNFKSGLERHAGKLATDSVVVSDTIWITRGKPSTPAGLRGLQGFSITLETAAHDLHSGLVGGAARNPLTELAWLIGKMVKGKTGEVKIPGFYDDVEKLSKSEKKDFARSGFEVETFRKDHELTTIRTTNAKKIMESIWAQPTLEVHGIVGGYVGPGIKSAVPARAEAKLSCRLVPGMTCAGTLELITRFVKARIPDAVVKSESSLEPYKSNTEGPYAEAVRDAYAFGFGERPAFTREGGSIGAVSTMEKLLGAGVYFLGLSLPEHGYHAPNENYDWEQASGGIPMFAHYFESIASIVR
jgi:acetylornithine deacetylase/succinyl-diaminopimelate desuccinylase-like protein